MIWFQPNTEDEEKARKEWILVRSLFIGVVVYTVVLSIVSAVIIAYRPFDERRKLAIFFTAFTGITVMVTWVPQIVTHFTLYQWCGIGGTILFSSI